MPYTQQDLLRVARRVNNTKRSYLLVNPLQAKHIPVPPSRALEMMGALGDRLAEGWPEARLVIGFAETATAIGAAAAERLGEDCVYLHTTRESFSGGQAWLHFSEEHSHAVDHALWGEGLGERIARSPQVILVDDELSTGRTLRNMAAKLRERYPQLEGRELIAASLLSRVSPEDEARLREAGIFCVSLVRLEGDGAEETAARVQAREAEEVQGRALHLRREVLDCAPLPDPRLGVPIGRYQAACQQLAQSFAARFGQKLPGETVVLGSEECMYPALVLGALLEERGLSVRCHATTRSPIGISQAPGYPITGGVRLQSFYDRDRTTYLYDLSPCSALVVVTDAPACNTGALEQLAAGFGISETIFCLQGDGHVWYI